MRTAERRLQAAQLASDVAALDELLDDRLVSTGPDGALYGKQDDGQPTVSRPESPQIFTRFAAAALTAATASGSASVSWAATASR